MKKHYPLFTLCFIAIFNFSIYSQIQESYFFDEELKGSTSIDKVVEVDNGFIVGGTSFITSEQTPFVMNIDTLGEVIWSTMEFETSLIDSSSFKNLHISTDGFVYALTKKPNIIYFWKIDVSDGETEWVTTHPTNYNSHSSNFLDRDSSTLLLTFTDNYNGSTYQEKLIKINKTNGNVLSSLDFLDIPWQNRDYGIDISNNYEIYTSFLDSIVKFDSDNLTNVTWSLDLSSYNVKTIQKLLLEGDTVLYAFGSIEASIDRGIMLKINAITGSIVWSYIVPNSSWAFDMDFADYAIHDNSIFASWRHIYVGGGDKFCLVTKININTGDEEWIKYYDYTGIYTPFGGGESAFLSIDVDSNGDVYGTGYYDDANYGPENWGIAKLDGNNGDLIYEKTITQDTSIVDDYSEGKYIKSKNGKVYCFGNLERLISPYNGDETIGHFVILNQNTGDIEFSKEIGGSYRFLSKVVKITSCPTGTFILKQFGRFGLLEFYDLSFQLVWSKKINKSYIFFGEAMEFSESENTIYIAGKSTNNTSQVDSNYYSNIIDSINVLSFDLIGNEVSDISLNGNVQDIDIYDLAYSKLSGEMLIIYNKNNLVYVRNISNGVLQNSYDGHYKNIYLNNQANVSLGFYGGNNDSIFYHFGDWITGNRGRVSDYEVATGLTVLGPTSLNNTHGVGSINTVLRQDSVTALFYAYDLSGNEKLYSFDLVNRDTIWSNQFSTSISEISQKMISTGDNSNIYSISNDINNSYLRKINPSNGQLIWGVPLNSSGITTPYAFDLSYQTSRDHIVIAGSCDNSGLFVLKYDTMGNFVSLTTQLYSGVDTKATTIEETETGELWVGGEVHDTILHKNGFLFMIDSASVYVNVYDTIAFCDSIFYDNLWHSSSFNTVDSINYVIQNTHYDKNNSQSVYYPLAICSGDTFFTSSGQVITQSGTFVDTLETINNCDSFVFYQVSILPLLTDTFSFFSCDSVILPSFQIVHASGQYIDSFLANNGCDSIVVSNVTIEQYPNFISIDTISCQPITLYGQTLNNTSTIYDTLSSAQGCDSIIQEVNFYRASISGQINTSNNQPLINTKVYLIGFDDTDSSLFKLDSVDTDNIGNYAFNVFNGNFYVKATPDSTMYPNELPTYYYSSVVWQNSQTVNCDTAALNFNTQVGVNPGGNGFIGGLIGDGAGKNNDIGNPLSGLIVVLINDNGDVVAYTTTNSDGYFSFENIPCGDYEIWVDDATTDNLIAPTVSLVSPDCISDSISFVLENNQLIKLNPVNINEIGLLQHNIFIVPNPAQSQFEIQIEGWDKTYSVQVFNALGMKVFENQFQENKALIESKNWSSGLYFVSVKDKNGLLLGNKKVIISK